MLYLTNSYEFGNKAGKLLARALQKKKMAHNIHVIKSPSGDNIADTNNIANHLATYFSKLYNLPKPKLKDPAPDRSRELKEFLSKYSLCPLNSDELAELDLPISTEEAIKALKQLKAGKSPGGLSTGYYKSFSDILIPQFVKTFNDLHSSSLHNKDNLEAHITLIPKPRKDTIVSNYCPISLLNVDVKLYAKILANRLLPLLSRMISTDQVGFIPGREASDNTTKAINIHHWLTSNTTKLSFP